MGVLVIQQRRRTRPQVPLTLSVGSSVIVETRVEGSRVLLSIDDTGPGVPASEVQTIFQPFFTTKGRGKGTGLGLTICSDVVTRAGPGGLRSFNTPACTFTSG